MLTRKDRGENPKMGAVRGGWVYTAKKVLPYWMDEPIPSTISCSRYSTPTQHSTATPEPRTPPQLKRKMYGG